MKSHLEHDVEQAPAAPQPVIRDDTKFAAGKIAFFQYLCVAVFLYLLSGFWDLQIRNPEVYHERAEANRIKATPILAPRGKILDRDGRVIVDNHASYSLILSREAMKEEHLRPIAEGLGMDYSALVQRVRQFHAPKYIPIVIKEDLSPQEVSFVESHRDPDTFPEMELISAHRRLYPRDGIASHVMGYVGEISEAELDLPDFAKYHPGDVIGKEGVERQYNDILMGIDGQRRVEVDNRGAERQTLVNKPAVPGRNVQLSLDLDLQVVAELALEGRRGAVVALDPRNGEVLAMVSHPNYDANLFATRIRSKDWKALLTDPGNPLLDRAIQAQQAPGSTFKPIMALAGLETGVITDDFRAHCPGGATFYGHYFKCHSVHGVVDLHKGITQSCDVFFYTVGNRMGIDNIAKYSEMAGFGHRTGIDLPHEAEGTVPSTQWKWRLARQKWYAGETISVSIGQGATTVTPLQLAKAIGGIAVGGVWHQPHVLKGGDALERAYRGNVRLANVEKVIYGMYGVVNEGGTGVRAKLPGLNVCGKTGSAQVVSNQMARTALGRTMKDNAWFVAFAPREAPEIVVAALFEGGVHGMFAAPIVRDVIKAYFDKKVRNKQMEQQVAALASPFFQLASAARPEDVLAPENSFTIAEQP